MGTLHLLFILANIKKSEYLGRGRASPHFSKKSLSLVIYHLFIVKIPCHFQDLPSNFGDQCITVRSWQTVIHLCTIMYRSCALFFNIWLCRLILFSFCNFFTLRSFDFAFFRVSIFSLLNLHYYHVALFYIVLFHVAVLLCYILFILHFCTFIILYYFHAAFFRIAIFLPCTFFVLHSFHVAYFFLLHSLCISLFLYCTFFMLRFIQIALFSLCPFFILHYFHPALFLRYTLVMLHFFRVTFLSCCTFFVLHSCHVAFFSCYTLFMLHFFSVAFYLVWAFSFECFKLYSFSSGALPQITSHIYISLAATDFCNYKDIFFFECTTSKFKNMRKIIKMSKKWVKKFLLG